MNGSQLKVGAMAVGGDGDGKHFDVNYFWPLGTMNF